LKKAAWVVGKGKVLENYGPRLPLHRSCLPDSWLADYVSQMTADRPPCTRPPGHGAKDDYLTGLKITSFEIYGPLFWRRTGGTSTTSVCRPDSRRLKTLETVEDLATENKPSSPAISPYSKSFRAQSDQTAARALLPSLLKKADSKIRTATRHCLALGKDSDHFSARSTSGSSRSTGQPPRHRPRTRQEDWPQHGWDFCVGRRRVIFAVRLNSVPTVHQPPAARGACDTRAFYDEEEAGVLSTAGVGARRLRDKVGHAWQGYFWVL